VSGQAPTEAEVRELREMLTARYGRDEEWHDEELVALCDAYLAQRDEIERLQALHLRRTQDTDHDLRELLAEVAAQRDVVDAARAYLAVPRKVEPDADGILRFDFLPQQEARKKLAEAVAAVVSGIPEKP
jgi:lipopolysaccharide biosynthesis regulator YciM